MTIRKDLLNYLVKYGMSETQAKQVFIEYEKELDEYMRSRLDDDTNDHPLLLMTSMIRNLRRVAFEWIKVNIPNAWYRDVFDSTLEYELEKK